MGINGRTETFLGFLHQTLQKQEDETLFSPTLSHSVLCARDNSFRLEKTYKAHLPALREDFAEGIPRQGTEVSQLT